MSIVIIIFLVTLVSAYGMLVFRAWEINSGRISANDIPGNSTPVTFRQIEKNMLYLTKHIVQALIVSLAKWWFIATTKTQKWIAEKWPKVYRFFVKEKSEIPKEANISFMRRAMLESKIKIKRVKEKVKKEHE